MAAGERSATAAEDAAITSRRSAEYAGESADHAKVSAEASSRLTEAELQRDHRELRPEPSGEFVRIRNNRTQKVNIFYRCTLPRTYRVKADALTSGGARSPLNVDLVVPGGIPQDIFIGEAALPLPQSLEFRFWPPIEGDAGEFWRCPCARQADSNGAPHWVHAVVVRQPDSGEVVY
ncbi:hypothetical protein ACFY36_01960 [Actinoplanes sp. NPDC000266]